MKLDEMIEKLPIGTKLIKGNGIYNAVIMKNDGFDIGFLGSTPEEALGYLIK